MSITINDLANKLIEEIFKNNNPFNSPIVVFQSKEMEQWFRTYWLKNTNSVLMGVDFYSIDKLIKNTILLKDEDRKLAIYNKKQLIHSIIDVLSNYVDNKISFNRDYYVDKNKILSNKLYDLSCIMANVFEKYDNNLEDIPDDQKELYDKVKVNLFNKNLCSLRYILSNNVEFKNTNRKVFFFNLVNLEKIYIKFIDEYKKNNNVFELSCSYDDLKISSDIDYFCAPSILREIEIIHSKICNLIKTDNFLKLSDILVLAPNISIYENSIRRVFHQDDKNYPNIPFNVYGSNNNKSYVLEGLKTIISIIRKGSFNRNDVFNLISNPYILLKRNITNDDVNTFLNTIKNLNIYRSSDSFDDWDYSIKRILLSKLVEPSFDNSNIINIDKKDYIPYSSIDINNEFISKYICFIDDLNTLINNFRIDTYITEDIIDRFDIELQKWFGLNDETSELDTSYTLISNELKLFKSNDSNKIPFDVVFNSLLNIKPISPASLSNMFSNGITFTNLNYNNVYSSKYLFVMGLSSNDFPNKYIYSELDKSNKDDLSSLEKLNVIHNCISTTNKIFISYVNKDLTTDEDFYPSTVISDLEKVLDKPLSLFEYSLDEFREYNELYTRREVKNKDGVIKISSNNSDEIENLSEDIDKGIVIKPCKLTNIRDFLKEPLSYKAKQVLGKDVDDTQDLKELFEPFELNHLDESTYIKLLIKRYCEGYRDIDLSLYIKKQLELTNQFKDDAITEYEAAKLYEKALGIIEKIEKDFGHELSKDNLSKFSTLNFMKDNINISISNNISYLLDLNNHQIKYRLMKEESEKLDKNIIELYVVSLFDIGSKNDDLDYEVNIISDSEKICSYSLNRTICKEILFNIMKLMNDYSNNILFGINYLTDEDVTFQKVSNPSDQKHPWKYFELKDLFDMSSQTGYTDNTFDEKFKEYKELILPLVSSIVKVDGE